MTQKIRLEISSPNHSRGKSTVREICKKALINAGGWTIRTDHHSFYSEILHLEKPYEIKPGGKE